MAESTDPAIRTAADVRAAEAATAAAKRNAVAGDAGAAGAAAAQAATAQAATAQAATAQVATAQAATVSVVAAQATGAREEGEGAREPVAGAPRPAEAGQPPSWWRLADGRWVVGDPGRQPEVVPSPQLRVAGRPDTVIDGADLGAIAYRAVSLRGLSHQENGKPRQDSFALGATGNGRWLFGCVADGVSEASRSHLAADLACEQITVTLRTELTRLGAARTFDEWQAIVQGLPWQEAVDRANAAILAAATDAARELYARDNDVAGLEELGARTLRHHEAAPLMSCTAIGFVVSATPTDDGLIPYALAVAAGDSSAQILSDGRWRPITAVKSDDDRSAPVPALPREVTVRPVAGLLRPGDALAIISDGVGDPLGSGAGVVGRFLAEMWARPPGLLAFAGQVAFYRKSFADDRTAVVVWGGRG